MTKVFPCWVCKGEGSWIEPVTDEGQGPLYECSYCEGEGMIEIGGKVHMRIRAEKIGMEIAKYGPKEEYTYEELRDLGEKALALTTIT